MRGADLFRLASGAAVGSPWRTALSVLAMAIGVAAVVVLTALGDGARRYVLDRFASLGSNLVIVLPGRSSTGGFNPANAITSTPRDLTVLDAAALRRAPAVLRLAPLSVGTSEISYGGRLRETIVAGTTAEFLDLRRFTLAEGRFLPEGDWSRATPVAVLGATIRTELFGNREAVGELVRIGDRRVRVVGVLAPVGQGLGMNTDENVIVPVALAQAMFNTNSLFRIMVEARDRSRIEDAKQQVLEILRTRHGGGGGKAGLTPGAVVATFDRLLTALTGAVAAIAAISLAVAGILIMNVMLVSVSQRTGEIGLLKALGADPIAILGLFLTEAAMLALAGAVLGYLLGQAGAFGLRLAFPVFPAYAPAWAVLAAITTALVTGLLFGLAPARRAARLDAVVALGRHL